MPKVLLFTIDVEEFTLPAEYGLPVAEEECYRLGAEGLERMAALLERHGVAATLFATAAFARRHASLITRLVQAGHELGLHALEHRHDYPSMPGAEAERLLREARTELQTRFGQPVHGYRANRFRSPAREVVRALGFRWTSNLHPARVFGAYDHSKRPRTIHEDGGVIEVPISATPRLRLPVSWFWMRNLGYHYTVWGCRGAWREPGYLNLYVHPWEAADLPRFPKLPAKARLSMRRTGPPFIALLDRLLGWCRRRGFEPMTISAYLAATGRMPPP